MNRETIFQALSGEDSRCSLRSFRNRLGEGLTHLSNFCLKVNLCLLFWSLYLFGFDESRRGRGSSRDIINKEQEIVRFEKILFFLEIYRAKLVYNNNVPKV